MARATREQVVADLRRSALVLFVAQGYGGASLSQIAAGVGISKAALLYHVSSKEQLLADLLEQPAADLRSAVTELQALPEGPGRLEQVVSRFVDLALAHRLELALLLRDGDRFLHLPPVEALYDLVLELRALLVADDAPLADQVRASVALVGTAQAVLQHADAPEDDLHPALAEAALAVLSRP